MIRSDIGWLVPAALVAVIVTTEAPESFIEAFFRDAVLSSYETTCCITGLAIPECLVASHIVPWSEERKPPYGPVEWIVSQCYVQPTLRHGSYDDHR